MMLPLLLTLYLSVFDEKLIAVSAAWLHPGLVSRDRRQVRRADLDQPRSSRVAAVALQPAGRRAGRHRPVALPLPRPRRWSARCCSRR